MARFDGRSGLVSARETSSGILVCAGASSKSELLEEFVSFGTAIKRKPTEVDDRPWVYHQKETGTRPNILGKWLVFKHFDFIDDAWERVYSAMDRNELGGCVHAKCSTVFYNPGSAGPGPNTQGVMCVYTEKANMDAVGFKLIEIVRQDIRYKLDETTYSGAYSHSSAKVSSKTIYWNGGKPSFTRDVKATSRKPAAGKREDRWQVNVVRAPEPLRSKEVAGWWVLTLEYDALTELWHTLKGVVESKDGNFGVIKMVCPPKKVRSSRTEKPVFHMYTSKEDSKTAGLLLIEFVARDIEYEESDGMGGRETLFWNNGSPGYREAERRGVKRTREEDF